ncbi:MAG: hypothetical protein AB1657_02220 [Candidatus Micrarchaeota archaeon]
MVREPTEKLVRERSYSEVFRDIERRVEERHGELTGVPQRRIAEKPEVQVDRKAQQLAEKLADALDRGVKALDRW